MSALHAYGQHTVGSTLSHGTSPAVLPVCVCVTVLQVTLQKEVQAGAVLQQVFVAEFVVEDHFCDSCTRVAANPDQWVAVVQVSRENNRCA